MIAAASFIITTHARVRFAERGPECVSLEDQLASSVPVGAQRGDGFMRYLPCGLVAAGRCIEGDMIVTTVLTRDHAMANMQAAGLRVKAAQKVEEKPKPPKKLSKKQLIKAQRRDVSTAIYVGGVVVPAPVVQKCPVATKSIDPLGVASETLIGRYMLKKSDLSGIDTLSIHLACLHAMQATPKETRKADLKAAGIDPGTLTHIEYTRAYKAAKLTTDTLAEVIKDAARNSGDPGDLQKAYNLLDSFNPIPRALRSKSNSPHEGTSNDNPSKDTTDTSGAA